MPPRASLIESFKRNQRSPPAVDPATEATFVDGTTPFCKREFIEQALESYLRTKGILPDPHSHWKGFGRSPSFPPLPLV